MSRGWTMGRSSTWKIVALRFGPPEVMARITRGEPVDPAEVYFRSAPRFETAEPAYQWLTRPLFIAAGAAIRTGSRSRSSKSASARRTQTESSSRDAKREPRNCL